MISAFSRFISLIGDFFASICTVDGIPIVAFVSSIILVLLGLAAWRIIS